MSDIIVAADQAQFALPEVKVGLFAAAGGAFRLAQQLPKKLAMEYMLTGDPIPAARAAEFGMVNPVVPLAALLPTELALAEKIVANAPLSVQASRSEERRGATECVCTSSSRRTPEHEQVNIRQSLSDRWNIKKTNKLR